MVEMFTSLLRVYGKLERPQKIASISSLIFSLHGKIMTIKSVATVTEVNVTYNKILSHCIQDRVKPLTENNSRLPKWLYRK